LKKFSKILLAALLLGVSFWTFEAPKAEAASSSWSTQHGIRAMVYTDRSGNYPKSDSYIGVTGKKTAAGGKVYYRMELDQRKNGAWIKRGTIRGEFSSQTPMKKFHIDNYLKKGQSGTFRVMLKIWKEKSEINWLGDHITNSFKVYN